MIGKGCTFFAAYDLQIEPNDLANSPVHWCVRLGETPDGDNHPVVEIFDDPLNRMDDDPTTREHDDEHKDAERVAQACARALNEELRTKSTRDPEYHKQRHKMLHACLDELVADFVTHTRGRIVTSTIMDLIRWSYTQTEEPTPDRREEDDGTA